MPACICAQPIQRSSPSVLVSSSVLGCHGQNSKC